LNSPIKIHQVEILDWERMKKVRIDDIDVPPSTSQADIIRPLSAALGTTDVAINYFEIAPGESFGYAYHRHNDQEEVFYIQSGTATFETETGDVDVEAGEIIRFESGESQLGTNQGDDRVTAIALGAPRGSEEIEYFIDCPECDERTIQLVEPVNDETEIVIRCSECGTETDRFSP
jgi:uncharacterized cupin superfamily protein